MPLVALLLFSTACGGGDGGGDGGGGEGSGGDLGTQVTAAVATLDQLAIDNPDIEPTECPLATLAAVTAALDAGGGADSDWTTIGVSLPNPAPEAPRALLCRSELADSSLTLAFDVYRPASGDDPPDAAARVDSFTEGSTNGDPADEAGGRMASGCGTEPERCGAFWSQGEANISLIAIEGDPPTDAELRTALSALLPTIIAGTAGLG